MAAKPKGPKPGKAAANNGPATPAKPGKPTGKAPAKGPGGSGKKPPKPTKSSKATGPPKKPDAQPGKPGKSTKTLTTQGTPVQKPSVPRKPSRWNDVADPKFASDPTVSTQFRGPGATGHKLTPDESKATAAFVTNNGKLPPSIAARPDVAADPTKAVRYNGAGKHAEQNLLAGGDLRDAVQDAVLQSLRTGDRVTVRIAVSRSPCSERCADNISDYVRNTLPGALRRPPGVSDADWAKATRNVDLELHTPHAYEGDPGATDVESLLRLEESGVKVVVMEPSPGQFRLGNAGGGGKDSGGNDGGGGEALNDTLGHLDDYRKQFGRRLPGHWAG